MSVERRQTVESTRWRRHIARQGNNRATQEVRNYITTNDGSIEQPTVSLSRMRREHMLVVRPLFRAGGRGVRYPPPRTPTSNGTNKPKVPLVDFWA